MAAASGADLRADGSKGALKEITRRAEKRAEKSGKVTPITRPQARKADPAKATEVGKLLTARYVIIGKCLTAARLDPKFLA